jgi:four helix bundle protein
VVADAPKKPKSYRDLVVWQKSMAVATIRYRPAASLPQKELFASSARMRRAAVSIPASVADGFRRWHRKEYVHLLRIANGSLKELESHFLIAESLGYLQHAVVEKALQATEGIGKMLFVLI